MKENAAIVVENVVRRFGDTVAVDGISLSVTQGEVFGFLGHNGAGKTTTVRLLNGVLACQAGTIRTLGFDPIQQGVEVRRRTGVLTENPSLDERLSARENLTFYAELYDVPPAHVKERIEHLLVDFDLAERADEKVGGYSKGMKQRLALARPLLHEPELLFLDEPTSGLDPVAALHVRELITRLSRKEGRTVFICTHNLVEAQRLCDRVAVLEHGRILAIGTPDELRHRYSSRQQVEIELHPDDLAKARQYLDGKYKHGVEEHNGNSLIVSGLGHAAIPQVIQELSKHSVRIYRVMPQEPSLEDVYFALHGTQEVQE
jgi:ABC-2 type transport system ATP-binding protein